MPHSIGQTSPIAVAFFVVIVAATLAVTHWTAQRMRTMREYYASGGAGSALQNGLALAGDFMSAASLLGISGMVALKGYDGMIYAVGWLVGWPALMFLVAEPLRNLGKFTVADVVAFRLRQAPVRIASAVAGILTVLFYAIAQMVAAGSLVRLMFGIRYAVAESIVGAAMLAYVLLGTMVSTTWMQIVKAVMLLAGVTLLTGVLLWRFGFDPSDLCAAVAQRYGQSALEPGGLVQSPVEAVSLGLALMFGLLGLPHVLMRFHPVPDARLARKATLIATGLIGYFYLIIPIVGFGASALVGRTLVAQVDPGGNMAAPLLAELLLGTPFLGFIAAVAFATILAVVSGLTLAGASAYSHDIYVSVLRKGRASEEQQVRAAKTATLVFGVAAVALGILFEGQNVAYLVGLAFAIAASAHFPALLMSVTWKRFTTWGAVVAILVGTLLSTGMIILGPTVWVDVLGRPRPLVALRNPCIVSMTASFVAGWLVSILKPERSAQVAFENAKLRIYLGADGE